ncbi:MAG: lamin tail domain-containing protein [Chloroflexi bacterium]|nr:lamin tail domain-containing protein [Chloroflexota bacterium]
MAALVLVGCSDDDDDDDNDVAATAEATDTATTEATETATETATAEATEEATTDPTATAIAGGGPIIEQVVLGGADASIVLVNGGEEAVSLDGWFLCNFPDYWPLPAMELAPGARLTVHAGAGTDTADELYADGGYASLNGGDGEFALYSSNAFGDVTAIVSYVGWGAGNRRLELAQEAGIWGDVTLEAVDGATISHNGGAPGAEAYTVE